MGQSKTEKKPAISGGSQNKQASPAPYASRKAQTQGSVRKGKKGYAS